GACSVSYSVQSQWTGGFVANLTVTNTGSAPVNGWTLKFTFPGDQQITNTWNGVATQSGEAGSVTNGGYNATIRPGGNTVPGFQGTWTNSDATPPSFTLNGVTCTT